MISGFALIDKPAGWTSHDVVGRLRRLYGQRRVGHAGTLDPMATGVLVVGLGHATRLLRFVQGQPKTYEATIRLGQGTLTDDAEGEVTDAPGWERDDAALADAIRALTGTIAQVPSAVSAIKVDGVRSYARVRGGQEVSLAARPVVISRFEVLGEPRSVPPMVDVDVVVDCSSGTYVRALARDLGAGLGTAGHLTALRRTAIGALDVQRCSTLGDEPPPVLPTETVMGEILPTIRPSDDDLDAVRNGRRVRLEVPDDTYLVVDDAGLWVSVVTVADGASHIEVNAPS
ncbi:MAG: tRNA pseudouridine(55) synthase TruB [Actinobacteria bacterium]|nr:MAG: tRNA pseudouridine(55) synthase TruB [Actinomycetota bacterium]